MPHHLDRLALALALSACAPATPADDAGATSTSTGDIECSDFATVPADAPPVTVTVRNLRSGPIALRTPSCSGRASAIDGPDGSSDPLLPFEYACSDHVEHGICHPYAAPDGCVPQIAAVIDPGASYSELWDGATYRPRELPEACRGEPTPFVDRPDECAACEQRAPALPGPHEAVITAWTDVTCDGGKCSVLDLSATVEVRVPFTPPILNIDIAVE